jgi:hypothetical protein
MKYPFLIFGRNVTSWENEKSYVFVACYAEKWITPFSRKKNLPATEMNPFNQEYSNPLLIESRGDYTPTYSQPFTKTSFGIYFPFFIFLEIRFGGRDKNNGKYNHDWSFKLGFKKDLYNGKHHFIVDFIRR